MQPYYYVGILLGMCPSVLFKYVCELQIIHVCRLRPFVEARSFEDMLNNGSVLWSAHLLEHESVHFVDWSDSVASWGPSTLWTV